MDLKDRAFFNIWRFKRQVPIEKCRYLLIFSKKILLYKYIFSRDHHLITHVKIALLQILIKDSPLSKGLKKIDVLVIKSVNFNLSSKYPSVEFQYNRG